VQIYNFFDGGGSIVWLIVTLIPIACLVLTIFLIIYYMRNKKKKAVLLYKLVSMLPIIIMSGITILFSIYAYKTNSLILPALTGKAKSVVGVLATVESTEDNYRGETTYHVSFKAGDYEFADTYNTYSQSEAKEILKNQGSLVKITYAEQRGNCIIYKIETIITN